MRITCPACTAKYSIADEKVQNRLAKIRCRKCGTTIVIDGKISPPSVYAADGAAAGAPAGSEYGGGAAAYSQGAAQASGSEYTVDFGDNDQRTLTLEQIVDAYNSGEVVAETYVWTEGMTDWAQLGQIAEIVDALHAAAAAAAAAARGVSPSPGRRDPGSPWSDHPRHGGAPSARAAVSAAHGQDLFGHYAAAGSEEDVTTSALHDAAAHAAATGARNESSVLFSLSALTASAGTPNIMSSPPMASSSSQDDSGLIDLRALTSAAERPRDDHAGMGMGPLGMGSPLGASSLGFAGPLAMPAPPTAAALDMGPAEYPANRNRTGIYVGGGIALAAVVIAVAFILKPEPPRPVQQIDPATLGIRTAAPVEKEPDLQAKPPSTFGDDADAGAKKGAKGGKWRGGRSTKKGSSDEGSASPSGGSAAPAAKSSGGGPCGCAAGDLMCNMKCSAGK